MARHYISEVDRQYVCDRDLVRIAAASSESFDVFAGEVGGENSFGPDNIVCSAACALLVAAISDDPMCRSSATSSEPQPGTFVLTRHSSLIRSMFAIEV